LEQQLASVGRESLELAARINQVTRELELSAVRAPAAGRIENLRVLSAGAAVEPDAPLFDLVPDGANLTVETDLTPADAAGLKAGMAANVWLNGQTWRNERPLAGRVTWIANAVRTEASTGAPRVAVRVELKPFTSAQADPALEQPGATARLLFLTGQHTLLERFVYGITGTVANTAANDAPVKRKS
jgi:hemolysin D